MISILNIQKKMILKNKVILNFSRIVQLYYKHIAASLVMYAFPVLHLSVL